MSKIVFGQSGNQTGGITVQTVNLSAANNGAGVAIDLNSDAVGGSVTFSTNNNASNALNLGTKTLTVNAYSTISAAQVPNTTPSGSPATLSDIVTTGMVNLNTNATSGARIGQGPQIAFPYSPGTYYPIVIEVGQTMVNVTGKNTSGVWLMGNGASVNTGTVAIGGTLTLDIYNSNGIIYLTENINTGGQSINFAQPVRLRPSVGPGNTISILTGGGSVTFKKTFDDDDAQPAGTNALTINTGVGAVTFSGAIGNAILPAAKPIGGLTIQTAGAVSFGTNVSTAKTVPP